MLKLVTGSPGDGKTSNELWDFLYDKQYDGRPKFCTPIKGFDPSKHGVTPIEHIKDWEDLPDGSLIFVDEAQDYLGVISGREPPHWIKQLAKHRHRGFDFIMTTQSPMFVHSFARGLCKPHVHYFRPWNMKGARSTWDSVQNDPNTKTARKSGQTQLVTPNPKVFELYTSTVLDTHKPRPPWKLIVVGVLALLVLASSTFVALHNLRSVDQDLATSEQSGIPPVATSVKQVSGDVAKSVEDQQPVWTEETIQPRLQGMPWSAPVYDRLTAPSDFPRVAACIFSKTKGCNCSTQQGTPIDVPESACLAYVKGGSFDPWRSSRSQDKSQERSKIAKSSSEAPTEPQSSTRVVGIPETRTPRTLL